MKNGKYIFVNGKQTKISAFAPNLEQNLQKRNEKQNNKEFEKFFDKNKNKLMPDAPGGIGFF
jgi:hypothetical protein